MRQRGFCNGKRALKQLKRACGAPARRRIVCGVLKLNQR
jgi:hypothetical protein